MASFIGKNGAIADLSFLYIEWQDDNSPDYNPELKDIISEIDFDQFPEGNGIEACLPYLTFKQSEYLFNEIKVRFGSFSLKKVSLANNDEGKVKNRYKPSIDDEPFISPFVIDENYTNIIKPLMISMLVDPIWKDYSYDELLGYFNAPLNSSNGATGILYSYQNSLDISASQLPQFPREGEVTRTTSQTVKNTHSKSESNREDFPRELSAGNRPVNPNYVAELNQKIKKLAITSAVSLVFGLGGIGFGLLNSNNLNSTNDVLVGVDKQHKTLNDLQSIEHSVDVFGRYFMSNYYSGNKESIKEFLSNGDAKYTQPDKATIQSALLENISFVGNSKNIEVTYVIASNNSETGKNARNRVTFTAKKNNNATYGFLVTSEPVTSPYVSATLSSGK